LLTSVASAVVIATAPTGNLGTAGSLFYVGNVFGSAVGSAVAGAALARGRSFRHLAVVMAAATAPLIGTAITMLPASAAPAEKKSITLRAAVEAMRQPAVALLVTWQFLRTVFWGAASMSIPYWLNRLGTAAELVSGSVSAGTASAAAKALVGWYSLVSLVAAQIAMVGVGRVSGPHVLFLCRCTCVYGYL